jgi:hypothetical protein
MWHMNADLTRRPRRGLAATTKVRAHAEIAEGAEPDRAPTRHESETPLNHGAEHGGVRQRPTSALSASSA